MCKRKESGMHMWKRKELILSLSSHSCYTLYSVCHYLSSLHPSFSSHRVVQPYLVPITWSACPCIMFKHVSPRSYVKISPHWPLRAPFGTRKITRHKPWKSLWGFSFCLIPPFAFFLLCTLSTDEITRLLQLLFYTQHIIYTTNVALSLYTIAVRNSCAVPF